MDSHSSRPRRLLAVLVGTMALAPAAAASAATDWLPPADVSGAVPVTCIIPVPCVPAAASTSQVVMDAEGNTTVVWAEPGGAPGAIKLVWSARPAGGSFSAPDTITGGLTGFGFSQFDLAVDDAGNATVVFPRFTAPASYGVEAATRPAGGDFGAPDALVTPGPAPIAAASVAVSGNGDAVAAWVRGTAVEAAVREGGGAFGSAGPVSSASGLGFLPPGAAIDGDGNALVSWLDTSSKMNAAYRPAGGGFPTAPDFVSATVAAFMPVADPQFDDAGNATMLWMGGASSKVERVFRPKSGPFGSETSISAIGATSPQLAVAGDGSALAVWVRGGVNEYSTRAAGGEFASATALPGASFFPPSLAMNRRGDSVIAWPQPPTLPGNPSTLAATFRPAGGTVGPVEDAGSLGGVAFAPIDIAVDPDGNAALSHAFHSATPTPTDTIRVAGFDAAGPQLRAVQVPETGVVGEALSFGVTPVDVWSPVTSTSWAFGDGGSANGSSVQHAFGAPGSYETSVTATDSLGNATTAKRGVNVSNLQVAADGTNPVVNAVSMLRRRFAVGTAATAVEARKRKTKKGTAFRYRLSEDARVEIAIAKAGKGRKVGSKCRKPSAKLRKRKSCKRYVLRGTLKRSAEAGINETEFSGRIGTKALKPGRYRASIVATDAAGNASTPAGVTFRVVRP